MRPVCGFVQDMYDKHRGKKKGYGSGADSDDGQIGFGSSRAKKQLMSEEQVQFATTQLCLHTACLT